MTKPLTGAFLTLALLSIAPLSNAASPLEDSRPGRPGAPRWVEDYRFLDDPGKARDPFDGLRYHRLSESAWLQLGAEARYRADSLDKPFFGLRGINDDSYLMQRLQAHADSAAMQVRHAALADPVLVERILRNLISNAIKYSPEDKEIHLSIHQTPHELNIQVKDSGIGIPEEKKETIFDSFSQGSIEINRKYGGTGLGLTIVKKLVDLLGGEISLESEVGVGTVFQVELNLSNSTKEIKPKEEITYSDEILDGKYILVVEDNKINQMVTKKMLENKGIQCKIIDNGEEAVAVLKSQHTFDLVLMDVHMPDMSGYEVTMKIREINDEYFKNLPVIALTASILKEDMSEIYKSGMTDYHVKPFKPEELLQKITKYLNPHNS